jgi:hypothetical protein
MAISGKYGKIDIPGIRDDEPVFILRAQDVLAAGTIEIYRVLTSSHKAPLTKGLDEEIKRFHDWKGPRKMPD